MIWIVFTGKELFRKKTRKFAVMMEGRNVCLKIAGTDLGGRLGFFTTRWVEADGPEAASNTALNMVRQELARRRLENEPSDPPLLTVTEVNELKSFDEVIPPGEGFTFFPEENN